MAANRTPGSSNKVYFAITDDGSLMKIGTSKDPNTRIKALHPRVTLVGCMDGGFDIENAVHVLLEEFTYQGEWFNVSPDFVRMVKRLLSGRIPLLPGKTVLHVKLKSDTYREIKKIARREGRSIAWVARRVIKERVAMG